MVSDRLPARVGSAKADLRRFLDRIDNEEVRQARSMAFRLRRNRLDVLYLGNSTTEWVAPADTDRRNLHAMIAQRMVDPSRCFSVYGGSYGFALHEAYLRFAMKVGRPKAVVVPLWVRAQFRPWLEHPVYSRDRATRALYELAGDVPLRRIQRSFNRPRPEQWVRYRALKFETLDGLHTIGEYVDRLKSRDTPEPEKLRLINAYHLSHQISAEQPELAAVESLGRALDETGLPLVVYENPVPLDLGLGYWGEKFREVNESNFALITQRFVRGLGRKVSVIRTGMTTPNAEFVNPKLADEHLNQAGRTRLANAIVKELAAVRPDLVLQDAVS